jgi:hypothetical protein
MSKCEKQVMSCEIRKPRLTKPYAYMVYCDKNDKWAIGVAEKDEAGYWITDLPVYDTEAKAQHHVDLLNKQRNISKRDALDIVASSVGAQHKAQHKQNVMSRRELELVANAFTSYKDDLLRQIKDPSSDLLEYNKVELTELNELAKKLDLDEEYYQPEVRQ